MYILFLYFYYRIFQFYAKQDKIMLISSAADAGTKSEVDNTATE